MRHSSRFAIALVAVSAAAGCIDDPTQLSDDPFPITEEEAAILGLSSFYDGLVARDEADVGDGAVPDPVPAGAPAAADEIVAEIEPVTIPCDMGGSVFAEVSASGVIDEEAGEFEVRIDMTLTPHDCQDEGQLFTNGYPGVTLELILSRDAEDVVDVSGSLTGGLRVSRSADGPSAICFFDLDIEGLETIAETGSYRIVGTSCGLPVDRTVAAADG